MLISAGGSSGGRGLVSASGIVSPPSPSPPPAMRHSPRPRLPPPPSAESRASPPLKGRIVRLAERPQAAVRRHPAGFSGGLLPPSPRRRRGRPGRNGGPRRRLRVAARGSRGSAPAAAAPRGSSSAPIAACRVRSRGDQRGRRLSLRPRAFSAEQPAAGCGAASCRFQRRHPAA
jgi:hypothetical protein